MPGLDHPRWEKGLKPKIYLILSVNSHAIGIAIARPYDFEIDFVINPISESPAGFFVIILKFIIISIFAIKTNEKKLTKKKINFRRQIFINRHRKSHLAVSLTA